MEELNDTVELSQVHDEDFKPPNLNLVRCTSTPVFKNCPKWSLYEKEFLFTPPPNVTSDSGFQSDTDSSAEKSRNNGSKFKNSSIITRSRSRQWSGPSGQVSGASLISLDLRRFPKDDSGLEISRRSNERRFIYKPGLFEAYVKLDIIKRLHERGMMHLISTIWQFLTPQDLGKVMQISKVWKNLVEQDKSAIARYQSAKLVFDENSKVDSHKCSRLRNKESRKALKPIDNLLLSPVKSKPPPAQQRRSPRLASSPNAAKKRSKADLSVISPSKKNYRHKLFTEEAKQLAPDERLTQCPRCRGPSRIVQSQNRASCSRTGCLFDFCMLCRCLPRR